MRTDTSAARGIALMEIGTVALLALALSPPLLAQRISDAPEPRVEAGSTVRIHLPDSLVEGSIVQADDSGWKVELDGVEGGPLEIQPDSGTLVEVRTGRETKVLKGAGIGALTGALTGALMGAVSWEEPDGVCWFACDRGSHTAMTALGMGVLGTIGGAIIGAFPRDRWEEVTPPGNLQISPRPGGGVSLGGSLGF